MTKVGIRELKNHLSQHIERVKKGGVIDVAEWGKVVARILPVRDRNEDERIWDLVRAGSASWSGGKPRGARRRVKLPGGKLASKWISKNRR